MKAQVKAGLKSYLANKKLGKNVEKHPATKLSLKVRAKLVKGNTEIGSMVGGSAGGVRAAAAVIRTLLKGACSFLITGQR